jgi:ankyrin repeat protein
MEDPVVCADGHSYERAAITQWLLARDTSPCTNAPLLHKNVVPNHALRNLIAEVRGVRRPITLEEHVAAATPCCPEELDDSQDSTATATAPTQGEGDALELAPVLALGAPRRDDETAAAPAHAAEAKQPIEPCAALCVQLAIGAKSLRPRPVGKNALHWAMVEGLQSEQKQLRLLLNPQLAAQPDQGGNLPLHYAASSGVSTACAVACALAFMDGLEWANKTGRTPLEIARLEGNTVLADVLSGMLNRRHNELHACFGDGAAQEAEQVRLLTCRPELAAQKDTNGSLPLHIAATAGASLAAVEECVRIFPDAPRIRNGDGFLPHQLALEHGHRILAEALATRAGKALPSKPPRTVLARAPVPLAGANETVEGSAPSTIVSTAAPAAEAPAAEPAQE